MAGQFLGPGGLGRGELLRRSAGDYRKFEVPEGEGLRAPGVDCGEDANGWHSHGPSCSPGQAHRCCVCPANGRKRIPSGGLSGA